MKIQKIKWYIKQMLPLTYRGVYIAEGKNRFSVFKMWFGKCYNIDTFEIINPNNCGTKYYYTAKKDGLCMSSKECSKKGVSNEN